MIVLDSSAAIDYLLGLQPEAEWVEQQLDDAGWSLHAPHVFDVEVLTGVRRFVLRREITRARATERLTLLAEFPVLRYPHVQLLERAWELHPGVTPPDACYVALAEALDLSLVTTDRRLAGASGPRIEILAP